MKYWEIDKSGFLTCLYWFIGTNQNHVIIKLQFFIFCPYSITFISWRSSQWPVTEVTTESYGDLVMILYEFLWRALKFKSLLLPPTLVTESHDCNWHGSSNITYSREAELTKVLKCLIHPGSITCSFVALWNISLHRYKCLLYWWSLDKQECKFNSQLDHMIWYYHNGLDCDIMWHHKINQP